MGTSTLLRLAGSCWKMYTTWYDPSQAGCGFVSCLGLRDDGAKTNEVIGEVTEQQRHERLRHKRVRRGEKATSD
jgi:hypothetical protein